MRNQVDKAKQTMYVKLKKGKRRLADLYEAFRAFKKLLKKMISDEKRNKTPKYNEYRCKYNKIWRTNHPEYDRQRRQAKHITNLNATLSLMRD